MQDVQNRTSHSDMLVYCDLQVRNNGKSRPSEALDEEAVRAGAVLDPDQLALLDRGAHASHRAADVGPVVPELLAAFGDGRVRATADERDEGGCAHRSGEA